MADALNREEGQWASTVEERFSIPNPQKIMAQVEDIVRTRVDPVISGNPVATSNKGVVMGQEKVTEEVLGDVPEEFKTLNDAGRAGPGTVLAGDADAEPVVESHKD